MRRKTQIVLAITFMVAALVSFFSYTYVSEILRQEITNADEIAAELTSQLARLANNGVPDLASTRVNTDDPKAVRRDVAYYLSTDNNLNAQLESVVGAFRYVYDASIVDANGKVVSDSYANGGYVGPQRVLAELDAFFANSGNVIANR